MMSIDLRAATAWSRPFAAAMALAIGFDLIAPSFADSIGPLAHGLVPNTNIPAAISTAENGHIVSITDYGARCDGAHDDTAAIKAAWAENDVIGIPVGRVCRVTNILYPHRTPYSGLRPRVGIVGIGGIATLKAIAGGDTSYMVASAIWAENGAYAAYPILVDRINFDGNSIANNTFVNQTYGSIFKDCDFTGALVNGHNLTSTTKNGKKVTGKLVNNTFWNCNFHDNAVAGLRNGNWGTDIQIIGGFAYGNGVYGIRLDSSAGSQITGVHTYGNSGAGLYVSKWGFGSNSVNSYFEDDVVVNSIQNKNATFGSGNTFLKSLQYNGSEGGAGNRTLVSLGNHFGPKATLAQNYFGADRTLLTSGDVFENPRPFLWNGGVLATGNIIANRSITNNAASQAGGVFYDGLIYPNGKGDIAPNYFEYTKPLAASGPTTVITVSAAVQNVATAGFSLEAELSAYETSAAGGADTLDARISAQYSRVLNATTSAKKARVVSQDSGSGGMSVTVAMLENPDANGDNNVTITITIIHPATGIASQSNAAILKLRSINRQVRSMIVG